MNKNNISIMILAAGYGKRLRPITEEIPKPLVKVNKRIILQNTIDFLFDLKFNEIIINTHYHHEKINEFIKKNYNDNNIIISHEKELLDSAGAVKNALNLFSNDEALIINGDVFWTKDNLKDIQKLVENYKKIQKCRLLLVSKNKAHGIYRDSGDFIIQNDKIKRYSTNDEKYYYAGAQIISLDFIKKYNQNKFSFNLVWDELIYQQNIFGENMNSDWYHIGDIRGLNEAKNLLS